MLKEEVEGVCEKRLNNIYQSCGLFAEVYFNLHCCYWTFGIQHFKHIFHLSLVVGQVFRQLAWKWLKMSFTIFRSIAYFSANREEKCEVTSP